MKSSIAVLRTVLYCMRQGLHERTMSRSRSISGTDQTRVGRGGGYHHCNAGASLLKAAGAVLHHSTAISLPSVVHGTRDELRRRSSTSARKA